MRIAGLEETHARIKIARRNISNFRYADDTTLMAESEEELKSLLMKVTHGDLTSLAPHERLSELPVVSQLCRDPAVGVRNAEEA